MQRTTERVYPVVTADGTGVVSHAGTVLLSELADRVGVTAGFSEATDGLRARRSGHDPGRVLRDVAVAIADGAETISDVQALAEHGALGGPVASPATIWRVLDSIDPARLAGLRAGRAAARDRAWLARGELTGMELPSSRAAGKDLHQVVIDIDATLVTAHSEKEGTAGTFKGGYGYHPINAYTAQTAVADAGAGTLAVGAPLQAQVALVALGADVDGDVAAGPPGWHDHRGRRAVGGVGLAGPPGGLPARRGAVGLPADPGETRAADRAGCMPGSRCRH